VKVDLEDFINNFVEQVLSSICLDQPEISEQLAKYFQ
jgi:hypothetical protein